MPATLHAPSASETDMIDSIVRASEAEALRQAAECEASVTDVRALQKESVLNILGQHSGDRFDDPAVISVFEEAAEQIDSESDEREVAVAETPDAYVMKPEGDIVGVQHDDTRKVGISLNALQDSALAKRVSAHEGEHARQEVGSEEVSLPATGDPVIDANRTLSRLAFRESGAIRAEGGLNGHTAEYEGYVRTTDAVARQLDMAGENGREMVDEAGRTVAGFQAVHHALLLSNMERRLKEGKGMPEFSRN